MDFSLKKTILSYLILSYLISDLQRIQNTAARILTKCGDRNYLSINLLKTLHSLPVKQ